MTYLFDKLRQNVIEDKK